MASYIGAINQGTTSTRFMVSDRSGTVVAVARKEHEQIYPRPGWVERDPEEIWRRTQEVIADAMQQRAVLPKRTRSHGHHEPARNSRFLESKDRQAYCKCHLARGVLEATGFQARESSRPWRGMQG